MPKFMILFQSPTSASDNMKNSTPEQMQQGMQMWTKWREKIGEDKFDWGMPLDKGKHIEGGEVSDSSLTVSGYAILTAESMDEAVKLLKTHPHLEMQPDGSIEVLEFLPMPGM
jgi:hypothetical protein